MSHLILIYTVCPLAFNVVIIITFVVNIKMPDLLIFFIHVKVKIKRKKKKKNNVIVENVSEGLKVLYYI